MSGLSVSNSRLKRCSNALRKGEVEPRMSFLCIRVEAGLRRIGENGYSKQVPVKKKALMTRSSLLLLLVYMNNKA